MLVDVDVVFVVGCCGVWCVVVCNGLVLFGVVLVLMRCCCVLFVICR